MRELSAAGRQEEISGNKWMSAVGAMPKQASGFRCSKSILKVFLGAKSDRKEELSAGDQGIPRIEYAGLLWS